MQQMVLHKFKTLFELQGWASVLEELPKATDLETLGRETAFVNDDCSLEKIAQAGLDGSVAIASVEELLFKFRNYADFDLPLQR